jgi:hypothetical protein
LNVQLRLTRGEERRRFVLWWFVAFGWNWNFALELFHETIRQPKEIGFERQLFGGVLNFRIRGGLALVVFAAFRCATDRRNWIAPRGW